MRIIYEPRGRALEYAPLADYVAQHGPELSAGTADLLSLPSGRLR